MSKPDKPANRIITPKAILSYPHLFTPQATPAGGEPKFSACLIFEKGTDLTALKMAALEAAIAGFGEKAKEMIRSGSLRMPFRDNWAEKGYPEGSVYLNARSAQPPGIVSTFPGADNKPTPIANQADVYAGMYVRASLTAFPYGMDPKKTGGNRGVSFALNNLQKLGDGERLDNRTAASDEFEADMSAAPADLEDLM